MSSPKPGKCVLDALRTPPGAKLAPLRLAPPGLLLAPPNSVEAPPTMSRQPYSYSASPGNDKSSEHSDFLPQYSDQFAAVEHRDSEIILLKDEH